MRLTKDVTPYRPAQMPGTAVDERETFMAAYLHAHPADTRMNAINAVYTAHPGLYDRCRREETVDRHGATLKDIYDRAEAPAGVDPRRDYQKSASDEVLAKAACVLAKSAASTVEQAIAYVFSQEPALYAAWQRESRA